MPTSNKHKRTGETTRKGKTPLAVPFEELLAKDLKNKRLAAAYLSAAFAESDELFLLALRDVAQVHGGMSQLAQASKLSRENLYQILSRRGNPRWSSIVAILDKLGFRMHFAPRKAKTRSAA